MKSSHAIAVWLLERLGLDVALTGDLLEERERRRSAIWYWRQVLIAVWVGIWGAIRDHKALALRAVATGFAMEYLLLFLWEFQQIIDLPLNSIVNWIANLSLVLLAQTATGWVVARTHRAYQIPMTLMFLICFLPWFYVPKISSAIKILVEWDRIDPAYRPYPSYLLVIIFLTIVGVLLGGILARPKKPLPG
jgi:hypothetical protein